MLLRGLKGRSHGFSLPTCTPDPRAQVGASFVAACNTFTTPIGGAAVALHAGSSSPAPFLPTPWHPPPSPCPLLPDCYSTNVSSTIPFLKLILWCSFSRSAIFFPSPCSSSFAFCLCFSLQDSHLTPQSKIYTLPYSLSFSLALPPLAFYRWLLMKRGCRWEWVRREQGEGNFRVSVEG